MSGILILLLLLLSAALPVIIIFVWFRARKRFITPSWFLASLAAGLVSLLPAVLIQSLFPPPGGTGPGQLFFSVFIRIALVEEASRFIPLAPLLAAGNRRVNAGKAFYASLGFIAGLGFAMVENATYGIADINITLIRAFTAAPLHGACGIRAGEAVFIFRQHPVKALFLFISVVLIHGAYNLMILSPVLPSILAVPVAYAALFASLHVIGTERSGEN